MEKPAHALTSQDEENIALVARVVEKMEDPARPEIARADLERFNHLMTMEEPAHLARAATYSFSERPRDFSTQAPGTSLLGEMKMNTFDLAEAEDPAQLAARHGLVRHKNHPDHWVSMNKAGQLHSADGVAPSMISARGDFFWHRNGFLHGHPAVVYADGMTRGRLCHFVDGRAQWDA